MRLIDFTCELQVIFVKHGTNPSLDFRLPIGLVPEKSGIRHHLPYKEVSHFTRPAIDRDDRLHAFTLPTKSFLRVLEFQRLQTHALFPRSGPTHNTSSSR